MERPEQAIAQARKWVNIDWFYVPCDGDIHSIGFDTRTGLYFPSHGYESEVLIKAEADLAGPEPISGCHHFAACFSMRAVGSIVVDRGPGPAHVYTQYAHGIPVHFYTLKLTAFYYIKWLKELNPAVNVRWEKEPVR
jgi:hypothetical protein